jgi:predicted MFS family arabinose efflux permease
VTQVRSVTTPAPLDDRRALWASTGRPTLAVVAVIVCAAIPPFLVGALAPLIGDDLPFRATDVGISIAAYYLVSGLLSPLGGRAVHRIGVVRALRLSCLTTTVGIFGIAVATDALHITLALALLGIPNSVVQPAANAALAEVRAPRMQALVFGTVQASIPTATLVAGLVLGIASYAGGWRWTVLSVASLTLVALWLTRGLPPASRRSDPATPGVRRGAEALPTTPWILVALVATGFLASIAATSLPSYISSTGLATGLAPGVVAGAQVLGSIVCATTRIAAPLGVSHGTTIRRLVLMALFLGGGAFGYLLLGNGTVAGFLVGTVVAYAFGWGWNALFNQVIVAVRPHGIAAATGLTQGGVFLGGTVGPLAFAVVVHERGYGAAWVMVSGAALAAALTAGIAVLILRRAAPFGRPGPTPHE